ncbi:MAG: hypothetical protein IPM56_03050 [Ignavibacteriales bacterium]|nr:MAG: hypothetical protein IPM56_03050 [Ignavibacteriales bacterium]
MEYESLLTAIKNIETAILHSSFPVGTAVDKIISDQLKKIQSATTDTAILDLHFSINHNWDIYSGKKASKGFRAGNILVKQWILEDCEELKTYIQRYR